MCQAAKHFLVLLSLTCLALVPAGRGQAEAPIRKEELIIEITGSQYRFEVEVADTEEERARGLMFRESLPENEGMLFLYPEPRPVSFWMKNTYIPLDMLFIGSDGLVAAIAEQTQPLSETTIPSTVPVKAVLEINGGLAQTLGIKIGARVRSPAYFP